MLAAVSVSASRESLIFTFPISDVIDLDLSPVLRESDAQVRVQRRALST